MKASYRWLARTARMGVGLALVLAAFSTPAWAHIRTSSTPEIDPGSMAGAVALLSLGVLMVTDRRRNK